MKKPRIEIGLTKPCSKCGEVKDLCDFYLRSNGKRRADCKTCTDARNAKWDTENHEKTRSYNRAYKDRNPEKVKISQAASLIKHRDKYTSNDLIRLYGITLAERNAMEEAQGGACAICGSIEKLFVDHNHTTDVVRELLCRACNHGIGNAKESLDILDKMKAYLIKHNGS